MEKVYHSDTIKKSLRIKVRSEKAWDFISKITELDWLDGIKTCKHSSTKNRGAGASRNISFVDGTNVEEIIVGWKPKKYFSYIAVSGLPLRGYHATISIIERKNNSIDLEWESFFSSELMTKKEFTDFVEVLSNFYTISLRNLKISMEK